MVTCLACGETTTFIATALHRLNDQRLSLTEVNHPTLWLIHACDKIFPSSSRIAIFYLINCLHTHTRPLLSALPRTGTERLITVLVLRAPYIRSDSISIFSPSLRRVGYAWFFVASDRLLASEQVFVQLLDSSAREDN